MRMASFCFVFVGLVQALLFALFDRDAARIESKLIHFPIGPLSDACTFPSADHLCPFSECRV